MSNRVTNQEKLRARDAESAACSTIAALLTPPGQGALATIRVQGPAALRAVAQLLRTDPAALTRRTENGRLWIGPWHAPDGERVVVHVLSDYEIDISSHGGTVPARTILDDLTTVGVPTVAWQKITLLPARTLIEAEAIEALAHAPTLRTSAILLEQWHGAISNSVAALLELAHRNQPHQFLAGLGRLLHRAELGLHLVGGWKVALVGRPNAGKSSLFNALVGYNRAIVHETPGTTRDVLTAVAAIDGWPVEFMDCAGIRQAADPIEAEGMERAQRAIACSDWQLLVLDRTRQPGPEDRAILARCARAVVVVNKVDLPGAWTDCPGFDSPVQVSARDGTGIDQLVARLGNLIVPNPPVAGEPVPFTPRQVDLLRRSYQAAETGHLSAATEDLRELLGPGFIKSIPPQNPLSD